MRLARLRSRRDGGPAENVTMVGLPCLCWTVWRDHLASGDPTGGSAGILSLPGCQPEPPWPQGVSDSDAPDVQGSATLAARAAVSGCLA